MEENIRGDAETCHAREDRDARVVEEIPDVRERFIQHFHIWLAGWCQECFWSKGDSVLFLAIPWVEVEVEV